MNVASEWRSPAEARLPPFSRPTSHVSRGSSWSRSRWRSAAPDVVLLVHDERADPRERLAALREHSAGPVILATAAPSSELVRWALDAGIADVLTLPASSEGLSVRDREGGSRGLPAGSARAWTGRHRLLSEGRIRKVRRLHQPRGRRRAAHEQPDAARRSRSPVRRRRDHARTDAAEHSSRAHRHSGDSRRREARGVHGAARVGRRRSLGTRPS